jgi:hypothetical protein
MTVVAMVEMPWVLDVPPSTGASEAGDDNAAMTRGVLVGLGISVPLWFGFAWFATSLATALLTS